MITTPKTIKETCMKKIATTLLCSCALLSAAFAQDSLTVKPADSAVVVSNDNVQFMQTKKHQVYKIKPGVDIPVLLIGAGWSGYAFTKIYSKDPSTEEQIENLDRNDVIPFNRSAIDHYSQKAKDVGDAFFYGSMPLPLLLLADKKIRHDAGKVGFMFFETMSVTGLLYTSSVYYHDKYRPYAYNPDVPMDHRMRGGAKNSFYAGHVALVASSTFFMAKVYSDYHPNSGFNWVLFTIAGGATATTAYCRYAAGQHFPTDIMIGAAQGTLAGILIPHWHKNKTLQSKGLTVLPMAGQSYGVYALYRF